MNLATLRYAAPEWTDLCLRKGRSVPLEAMITIVGGFTRLGLMNGERSDEVCDFIKFCIDQYLAYVAKIPPGLQPPIRCVTLASNAAMALHQDDDYRDRIHRLIDLAQPTNSQEMRMLRQAIELTDYPIARPSGDQADILTLEAGFALYTSELQRYVYVKLKRRIDTLDLPEISVTEKEPVSCTNVDIMIHNLAQDGKKIAIEVDGMFHRTQDGRDLGKTQAKHAWIRKQGCHLVVIRAKGLGDPSLPAAIETAWQEILALRKSSKSIFVRGLGAKKIYIIR